MDSEHAFAYDDVEAIVKTALATTLDSCTFEDDKADSLTNGIIESCLKGLQGQQRPFKFLGECPDERGGKGERP